jgi:thiol-disulfide isomerase/thioredoxin
VICFHLSPVKAQLNNYNAGDTAPDFSVTDPDNVTYTLYQFTDSGKYVLIDFFGYWCGTCRTKAGIVDAFYSKYGCNQYEVVVLGIEGDGNNAQLHQFDSLAGLPEQSYPAVSGLEGHGDSVHIRYGVLAVPTLVAIGPDRKIINEQIYPSSTSYEIVTAFPENSIFVHDCTVDAIPETTPTNAVASPNPTRGDLRISIPETADAIPYTLCNFLGNVVYRGEIRETVSEIDISHLPNGLYLLSLQNRLPEKIKIVKVD